MSDIHQVISSSTSIATSKGILSGLVASVSTAASHGTLTCYDSSTESGMVIFQVELYSEQQPFVIFFADRFAPRFTTGLYIAVGPGVTVDLWATYFS